MARRAGAVAPGLLAGTSGPDMLELWQWRMLPGESFRSPGHPTDTYELLYVTEGELTLIVNNDPYQVAEGCSAVARTDAPHEYCNVSELPVVFTMTVYEKGALTRTLA